MLLLKRVYRTSHIFFTRTWINNYTAIYQHLRVLELLGGGAETLTCSPVSPFASSSATFRDIQDCG